MASEINLQTYSLPHNLAQAVEVTLDDWHAADKVEKLWAREASLWTGSDESKWLGWLEVVNEQQKQLAQFKEFAEDVKRAGFAHALLLGMGGSSLCPEVLRLTFGKVAGFPDFHVLDSTDPAQIKSFENKIDLANSLFFVSSKSGSTLEPNIFKQYFFERVKQAVGEREAGNRFVAITDPGSKLQQAAAHDRFRRMFFGDPSIGGRYSALSNFGIVPAAAIGLDVKKFLNQTSRMVEACGPNISTRDNPGVVLGAILGSAHNQHRDKITITASPGIHDLGAWLEQLLAESTGKNGKGLIPVDRESLASADAYGDDRVFVYLKLESDAQSATDAAIDALERAGQPVVRISVLDVYNLGQEFFRWEIATAVAGSIIGIDPFDQPDVEASKVATKKLTEEFERSGSLPAETPLFEAEGIKLFADESNATALNAAIGNRSLISYLKAHLDRLQPGDYFALLAYIEMNEAHERKLQWTRHMVRGTRRVATCLGFGPRFLHSTGQAYKGGPNTGVFLQVTCDDAADLPVPGQKYTFGTVKAAQARGDFAVLAERGRRALRVHLGADVNEGLAILELAIRAALE
jgi:transaldolase / glucose-6-phosphate isomerase